MRDFESHIALAEYMVRLTENETLYNSYFEWKKLPLDPEYVTRNKPFWQYRMQCRVCRYVWVIQNGLLWDKATQNAQVNLNGSFDLNQDPYNVKEMEIVLNNGTKKRVLQDVSKISTILLISFIVLIIFFTFVIRVKIRSRYYVYF